MRTVLTETLASPSICLAIESSDSSEDLEALLSQLGCACGSCTNLSDLDHFIENAPPALVVFSLDFHGQCSLQYCQNHPQLLGEIPVVFYASDPETAFEKSLEAIRLGAVDVLTRPLNEEKLARLVKIAQQKSTSGHVQAETDFFVGETANLKLANTNSSTDSPTKIAEIVANSNELANIPAGNDPANLVVESQSSPYQQHSQFSTNLPFAAPRNPSEAGFSKHTSNDTLHNDVSLVDLGPQALARKANHVAKVKELETWILGSSRAIQEVRSLIAEVAETKANVMIYGASGTGKELVATAVHKLSDRANGPFEPINMTEIPHELAESLLFGHEKGSFTGADRMQIGICEAAHGGTLFLDEIGEMALSTQPKLLRFLQEGTVKRIGSRTFKKVDVRVITATNRSPETIVKEGLMREDLFFRLHVVPIHVPPLQERTEDIEQLAMLFLKRYVKAYDRDIEGFTEAALSIFRQHDWPGNVRQLENVVERLVVFAKGRLIDVQDIPSEIHAASMFDCVPNGTFYGHPGPQQPSNAIDLATPLAANGNHTNGIGDEAATAIAMMSPIQRTERSAIVEALQRAGGHVIDAANLLGLGQATVYRKIKQYHIPHQRRRRRKPK